MSSYAGYLIETFITLAAVCGLAVVVIWTARRAGVAPGSGPIELRGYLPLDARRAIVLVKVGVTVFIVGVGEGGFTKLGEIADSDLPTGPPARGLTFGQLLARIRGPRAGFADPARVVIGSGRESATGEPAQSDAARGDRPGGP